MIIQLKNKKKFLKPGTFYVMLQCELPFPQELTSNRRYPKPIKQLASSEQRGEKTGFVSSIKAEPCCEADVFILKCHG